MVCKSTFCFGALHQNPNTLHVLLKCPSGSFSQDMYILERLVHANCVELSSLLRERYGLSLESSMGVAIGFSIAFRYMSVADRGLLFDLFQSRHPGQWCSPSPQSFKWSAIRRFGLSIDDNPLSVLCHLPD